MENLMFLSKISKPEQIKLVKQFRSGDKNAKDKLVLSCTGLVKQRITHLASENSWCYLYLNRIYEDLFHTGILGVLYALKKFDITRNTAFSSYAFFWIDAFLQKQFAIMRETWSLQVHDECNENVTGSEDEAMFDAMFNKVLCKQLLNTVGNLEREIVVLFFGLNCRQHTLKEIARKYGFSFQYAGKIKQQALQKMRNSYEYALKCA